MEKYFKDLTDEKYDVLIGNGFTVNNRSRDFDYQKFTRDLKFEISEKEKVLKDNIFFDTLVENLSKVSNIEEYIFQLKKFKGIASRVLTADQNCSINEIYNIVYQKFVEEFTSETSRASKEKKIPAGVDNIFSTNLFPDFNILVKEQDNLPINFIAKTNNKLYSNAHYSCNDKGECLSCYSPNSCCENDHMIENYFYKSKIFYMHGSTNVWYKQTEENKYEYSYTSKVNEKIQGMEPLFIIDGNGEGKKQRIISHKYTRHCFDAFRHSSNSLLIFGNSLSEQDSHIVNIISEKMKNDDFELYFSLYSSKTDSEEKTKDYIKTIIDILSKFSLSDRDKIFFMESTKANEYILK